MRDGGARALRYIREETSARRLHELVGAVGTEGFASALLTAVSAYVSVDYCMSYAFDGAELSTTSAAGSNSISIVDRKADLYTSGGLWRRDESLGAVVRWAGAPRLAHIDLAASSNSDLNVRLYRSHGVIDRIIVGDGKAESNVISLLRTSSSGRFETNDLETFERIGGLILSTVASHRQLTQASAARTLTSLDKIQARIAASGSGLSDREAQVCARIVWGLTSPSIAIDLGISAETATTYRKRAYCRLGISSQRDLMLWYLKQANPGASDTSGGQHPELTAAA